MWPWGKYTKVIQKWEGTQLTEKISNSAWKAFYKNALRTEFKGTLTAKTCQRMKWKRILGSSIQRPRLSKWIVWLTFIPPPSPPLPPGSQTIYFHEIYFFSSTAWNRPWPIFEYKETTFPAGSLTVTAASIYGPDNNSSDLSNMSKMHKQVPRLQQTSCKLMMMMMMIWSRMHKLVTRFEMPYVILPAG